MGKVRIRLRLAIVGLAATTLAGGSLVEGLGVGPAEAAGNVTVSGNSPPVSVPPNAMNAPISPVNFQETLPGAVMGDPIPGDLSTVSQGYICVSAVAGTFSGSPAISLTPSATAGTAAIDGNVSIILFNGWTTLVTQVLVPSTTTPTTFTFSNLTVHAPGATGSVSAQVSIDNNASCTNPNAMTLNPVTIYTVASGYVLAFGDSIAAGYGLGPSGPQAGGSSNGNPNTYSAVLAGDLGLVDRNFAVEGATAGIQPVLLGIGFGVHSQICRSVGDFVATHTTCTRVGTVTPPRLITMTVGADDIGFASCMTDLLESGLQPNNPCAGSNLDTSLNSLRTNLKLDLGLIHLYYPNVPVILTGYYNPLGDQTLLPADCPLVTAAVVTPLVEKQNWNALFKYALDLYVRQSNGIPGVPFQNIAKDAVISAFGRQVMQRLNNALMNAATGQPNVSFVPIDIGAFGLCSSSPLIFEPQVEAKFVLTTPLQSDQEVDLNFGLQDTCPGPKDPFENSLTYGPTSGTVSLLAGQVLKYSYYFGSNCVPHPTAYGQAVIAGQLWSHLP